MACKTTTHKNDDDDDGIMFLANRVVNFDCNDVTATFSTTLSGKPIVNAKQDIIKEKIITENAIANLDDICPAHTDGERGIRSADEGHVTGTCGSNAETTKNTRLTDEKDVEGCSNDLNSSQNEGKRTQINTLEDLEFDFLLPSLPMQRTTSLKQPSKKPKGSEGDGSGVQQKSVRFADALGLDLASIRHIINPDEPPSCTWRTYARKDEHVANEEVAFWRVRFVQPVVTSSEFRQRVLDRKVALESCSINNQDLTAHGVVRVANIGFVKDVKVRFSYNGWLTQHDVQAKYIANSNELVSDRFYFVFNLPGHLGVRNRIEFAIVYTVNGQTWWDSNLGYNYSVECIHFMGHE